jgi:hypothetical protein
LAFPIYPRLGLPFCPGGEQRKTIDKETNMTKTHLVLRTLLALCLALSMGIPVAALTESKSQADQATTNNLLAVEYGTTASLNCNVDTNRGFDLGLHLEFDPFTVHITNGTWARCFGYNQYYDQLASFLLIHLDTLRFPFEYGGKDWMIQLWKGQYVIVFNGAEIGLYEKPANRNIFYDCSDTTLDMSMRLYQGDDLFLDYPAYNTWWACAFRLGNPITSIVAASELRMTGTIRFEDQGMRDAFWASFEANKNNLITGTMEDMVFSFDWQAG